MSNSLAVAATTRVLQAVVAQAAADAVPGATVLTRRPQRAADSGQEGPAANVFLLQVAPNDAFRNQDLPARAADGSLRQQPRLALELLYLISFHGDDLTLVPQRLLGAVLTKLHRDPRLTPAVIRSTLAAGGPDDVMAGSDLGDQVEAITLAIERYTPEELSKIWSVLLQVPYSLSVLYTASVVMLEPRVDVLEAPAVKPGGVVLAVDPRVPVP